jgi:hypothetical protein
MTFCAEKRARSSSTTNNGYRTSARAAPWEKILNKRSPKILVASLLVDFGRNSKISIRGKFSGFGADKKAFNAISSELGIACRSQDPAALQPTAAKRDMWRTKTRVLKAIVAYGGGNDYAIPRSNTD